MPKSVTLNVITKMHAGKEADTILAQAEGYKRMVWEILNGNADREPRAFLQTCKRICQEQSEKGA
jgi:hypothetical protein